MNTLAKDNEYFLIVGMGATGYSIAKYLHRCGKRFDLFDTRASSLMTEQFKRMFPDANIYFESIEKSIVLNAKEVYISPGVPRDEYVIKQALAQGIPVVGDIELFLRASQRPIIGITGSNGKSTVTTLVGLAANEAGIAVAVGGNIGIPALELLEVEADLYVLELSSFQLESTNEPKLLVACHLNLSADHMDRYDSLGQYVMAKQRIFFGAEHVVYCLDDPHTRPPIVAGQKRYGFGVVQGLEKEEVQFVFCPQTGWLFADGAPVVHKDEIKIKGIHNTNNALALLSIAAAANIGTAACKHVLKSFSGLPHRCEVVAERDSVTFINDSKATNIGATEAAISGLAPEYSGIVLIAGGEGKGADFTALGEHIRRHVRELVLIGKDAMKISEAVGPSVAQVFASDMMQAVRLAADKARANEVVLLSPACASLDMYSNFEERGQVFASSVATVLEARNGA